ncbi:MAG: hypothetical protein ACI9DF_002547 [Verrucomicrobiales bacterium]|jgi:hypothetical protein
MISHRKPSTQHAWFPWALVLVAAWGAQIFAWRAAFYMDDMPHILMRDTVTGDAALAFGWKGRFLTFALWRGVFTLFGESSAAFHGLNWLLHGAVAMLSFGVLRGFVRLGPEHLREHASSLALWGALIFAVHPLCVEPVHYAAQTSLLLGTLLAMLAAGGFLKWRETNRMVYAILSIAFVFLAGMAKEAGFFHALILLFFMMMLGDSSERSWAWLGRRRNRIALWVVLGGLAMVFAQTWFGIVLGRAQNIEGMSHHWLTQSRVLGEYLWRMFVPTGLSSDHHIAWTLSWGDKEAVMKFIVVMVSGLWILERYLRGRRWFAALLGLCLFHLLLRFAYPVDEPMVEYRTYPCMPWVGLLIAFGVREVTDLRFPRLLWVSRATLALIVLSFAVLTLSRSHVWQSERTLVMNVLQRYPLNLRAMGIYFKNLVMDGQSDAVLMGAEMPDMVSDQILSVNDGNDRQFSGRRLNLDYAACQYYIIRAHLQRDDAETALGKAETLLADLITGRRHGGPETMFTACLSQALCYEVLGDAQEVERALEMARPLLPNADELPEMLDAELILLGKAARVRS